MVLTSLLTSKAQTTIPKPVRQALGIGPGDEVAYHIEGDAVILVRTVTLDWLMARFDPDSGTRRCRLGRCPSRRRRGGRRAAAGSGAELPRL